MILPIDCRCRKLQYLLGCLQLLCLLVGPALRFESLCAAGRLVVQKPDLPLDAQDGRCTIDVNMCSTHGNANALHNAGGKSCR